MDTLKSSVWEHTLNIEPTKTVYRSDIGTRRQENTCRADASSGPAPLWVAALLQKDKWEKRGESFFQGVRREFS